MMAKDGAVACPLQLSGSSSGSFLETLSTQSGRWDDRGPMKSSMKLCVPLLTSPKHWRDGQETSAWWACGWSPARGAAPAPSAGRRAWPRAHLVPWFLVRRAGI